MNEPALRPRAEAPCVEILINTGPGETRAALIERGVLQEIHVQRDATASAVGNIYLGIVQRVLAGMQAAFIEIGHERAAFLQVSDIVPCPEPMPEGEMQRVEKCLKSGERVLVQVVREDRKSTRLNSSHVAISYAVFCLRKKNREIHCLKRND